MLRKLYPRDFSELRLDLEELFPQYESFPRARD
jgi:hypothetical protein